MLGLPLAVEGWRTEVLLISDDGLRVYFEQNFDVQKMGVLASNVW